MVSPYSGATGWKLWTAEHSVVKQKRILPATVFGSLLGGFAVTAAQAFDPNRLGQGGSLLLADLAPIISQAAPLKREVDDALATARKKPTDVVCTGNRFPGQWVHLGGMRASPYACDFGGRWLVIYTTVRVSGPDGQVYETISAAAMKNASKLAETRPTWKWTTEDPNAKQR